MRRDDNSLLLVGEVRRGSLLIPFRDVMIIVHPLEPIRYIDMSTIPPVIRQLPPSYLH